VVKRSRFVIKQNQCNEITLISLSALFIDLEIAINAIIAYQFCNANYPPLKRAVKKIITFGVKKSSLFERSEFDDFRRM